jgi:hypothetical protein
LPPSGELGAADEAATSLFIGDVTGMHLISSPEANQPNRYLNDGKAAFRHPGYSGDIGSQQHRPRNLDGDGDLDAVACPLSWRQVF